MEVSSTPPPPEPNILPEVAPTETTSPEVV